MRIYTIGFTKTSAEDFFERLRSAGIRHLIDVRRRNTSHLAGFAKRDDLAYFLDQIVGARYTHELLLAPPDDLLDAYRSKEVAWPEFRSEFDDLLRDREIEDRIDRSLFEEPTTLLCGERSADRCHRRLVAERLAEAWGDTEVVHL